MKKISILLGFLVLSVSFAFSQWTYNFTYTSDAGNPGGVNTESDAPGQGTWTTIMTGPQGANVWSASTPLPFAFNFFGNPVTDFKASQNGLVTFDVASVLLPNANDPLPSVNLPDNTICGFWDEFTSAPPTGTGDDIRTNVFGTAPNRQFWITWYSFEMGNPVNSFSYFSIVLEETTNNIYIVDKYSTTSTLTSTVGVQLNATTAVEAGNSIALSSNGSANTDNDFYTFTPLLLVADDAGVSSMLNPTIPLLSGLQNVDVDVQNFGTNNLNSFTVNWEINGTPQTPFSYTSPPLLPGQTSTPLNLGSYNFPVGFTDLKFWTSSPNGLADGNPLNDTLEISACTALNGVYSIGGATPDFATITEANNALISCGVSGPVVFNIAPGTYNEFATLPVINGSSSTNTITFNGGSANTTAIVHDGVGQMATIGFIGGDYITFKNLTIQNTNAIDGWGVHLSDTSDYNMIDSCIILMDSAATLDVIGIVISGSPTDDFTEGNGGNYNIFSNLVITGGEMGVHMEGMNNIAGPWIVGNQFINNDISGMDDYGFYMDNVDSITIIGNKIYGNRNVQGDGIYCFDIANFNFSENVVVAPDYGIYISDGNFDFPVTGQSSLVNNMVKSQTDYGIYFDDVDRINVFHNTSYGNPGIYMNDFTNMDIRNNIFRSDSDFAFETLDDIGATDVVNYNLYWTPTSNTNFVDIGVNVYADLAAWQTGAPANNINSIEVEPLFVTADDLHRIGPSGNDLGDPTVGVLVDIDGEARPMFPALNPDMGADEYLPLGNDATLLEIIPSAWSCGDSASPVYAVVSNLGANTISSLPIEVNVTGDVTATLSTTYTSSIPFGQIDTVYMGTINIYAGGTVNFMGWTELATEQDYSNDTMTGSASYIPFEPVGINGFGCGVDSALIFASNDYPATYAWFDAPVGGTQVGSGNSFMVPSIATQNTYYLEYSATIDSLETTYAAGNGCGGGNMFDVISNSGSIITGFRINGSSNAGTSVPVNVYYLTGSYLGNETNAAAWTAAGSYTVLSNGLGTPSEYFALNSPIALPAGATIAVYLEFDADYTNGTNSYTNGSITINTGAGLCGQFSGVNPGRMFNGTVYFGGSACSNVRTPVSAQQVAPITTDLGLDSTVCGASITLDAGNPTATFVWSDGTTTQTNVIDTAGTYWVEVTDTNGCMAMDTVSLIISPLDVSLPATALICVGDSITLSPVITEYYGYTYAWMGGYPTLDITVNTTGTYTITVSDTLGCISVATTDLTVQAPPVAGFTDVLDPTGVILSMTSTATDADSVVYNFGDGSPVVSSTNATHTYTANGTYTVCQYVYNSCGADTTCISVTINTVGLEELSANAIQLFPNPTKDVVNVSYTGGVINELSVLTSDGKLVGTYAVKGNTVTIDVHTLPSGIYFVEVVAEGSNVVKRFVKE